MKYCTNCGKQIDDGIAFCPYCGGQQPQVQQSQPQQQYQPQGPGQNGPASAAPPNSGALQCPMCHSTDLIPTTETTTETSGGGYGAGKGCLGWLLLGPLGLLCGLCGTGVKSESKSVTYWVCKSCGHKFRSQADLMAEAEAKDKTAMTGIGGCMIVFGIICSILGRNDPMFVILGILITLMGVAFLAIPNIVSKK